MKLEPIDNQRLATLCGQTDQNLRHIERHHGVEINNNAHLFQIIGHKKAIAQAKATLLSLYTQTKNHSILSPQQIHLALSETLHHSQDNAKNDAPHVPPIKTQLITLKARNPSQATYVANLMAADVNFGIGPSGTGKTFLAVAAAVAALEEESVQRIVLVRPAVEAGESLGFLPGDLSQKVDPYLRPLYDALYEMMGPETVNRLIEKQIIEIAPLAYMRGRTLNEAFVILDEGQNTTQEQMKMFLTRIGFGTRAAITGDITQIDLPKHQSSGLRQAIELLNAVDGIRFTFFQSKDVVRHPLVKAIVDAYEGHDGR